MLSGSAASLLTLDPDHTAFFVIGVVGALFGVLCFIFRGFAEVYEAFYDLKARCAAARERFRQATKDRANDTG